MQTRRVGVLLLVGLLILASGCTQFNPRPLQEVGFEPRALSKTEGGVQVSVVALTEQETQSAMGVGLARHGIQPVWVKVENHESTGFVIPPMAVDHDYFSATEAAWQVHGINSATNARIEARFLELSLPMRVRPGETVSGFVFTNLDKGAKYVSVELLANGATEVRRFAFLAHIPDLKADYLQPPEQEGLQGTRHQES